MREFRNHQVSHVKLIFTSSHAALRLRGFRPDLSSRHLRVALLPTSAEEEAPLVVTRTPAVVSTTTTPPQTRYHWGVVCMRNMPQ